MKSNSAMGGDRIRVAVAGAAGRMGLEAVRAVSGQEDLVLVAAADPAARGAEIGDLAGLGSLGVRVAASVAEALASAPADVLVDFTRGEVACTNVMAALAAGASAVVGTTGIGAADLERMGRAATEADRAVLVAPNFALGAVLMMRFAAEAARYYQWAEIIERHHERKVDAPSGTALRTAALMAAVHPDWGTVAGEQDRAHSARGAVNQGIHIHSVRLPGLVAHQEVVLGGTGETLTIRHDTTDRTSFMPGMLLAVRRLGKVSGLVLGLEHLLD